MIDFFLLDENIFFSVALCVLIGFCIIEMLTTLVGAGLSDLVDGLFPDMDLDLDVGDMDMGRGDMLRPIRLFIGWMNARKLPVLILLMIFLFCFTASGLGLQSVALGITGIALPSFMAVPVAFVLGLLLTRYLGIIVAKVMPGDETEAVSEDSFIGKTALIVTGRAEKGKPAQARLADDFGSSHYIMVEPDTPGLVFETGDHVLILLKKDSIYTAQLSI